MDDETVKHLLALREVNENLILGLETAIFVMDKWDAIEPERRKSIIEKLQLLIVKSKEAYGEKP